MDTNNIMIKLNDLISEDRGPKSIHKGCLMAMIPKNISEKLVEFGKKIVPDSSLYFEGDEYGRVTDSSHITIRYGFTRDLNELEIRRILQGYKPFTINIVGVDKFESDPKFDVVKFKVESSILKELFQISGIYPNESKFLEYHPHITICYIKKGLFLRSQLGMNMKISINTICYSSIHKGKSYFEL